jgi:hypothetical protein
VRSHNREIIRFGKENFVREIKKARESVQSQAQFSTRANVILLVLVILNASDRSYRKPFLVHAINGIAGLCVRYKVIQACKIHDEILIDTQKEVLYDFNHNIIKIPRKKKDGSSFFEMRIIAMDGRLGNQYAEDGKKKSQKKSHLMRSQNPYTTIYLTNENCISNKDTQIIYYRNIFLMMIVLNFLFGYKV